MQSKLRTYWKNLNEDEKILLLLLPFPIIISVLTFGICICLNKNEDCSLVDILFWPLDLLHASLEMLCDGLHNMVTVLSADQKILMEVILKSSSIWQVVLFSMNVLLFCYIIQQFGKRAFKMIVEKSGSENRTSLFLHQFKIQANNVYKAEYGTVPVPFMFLPIVVAVGTYTLCICLKRGAHLLAPFEIFVSLAKCIIFGFLHMTKKTLQGLMWILGCNQRTPAPILVLPDVDKDWWQIPLIVVCIIVLALLSFFLVKWLIGLCKRMRLDNTILLINNDGKWEYAPSQKRLEIESAAQ